MKYSIIIPTLNEEKLLPKLLNQLNEKALRNRYQYEIIISDGGKIQETLAPFDLEKAISKFIFGKVSDEGEKAK